MVSRRNFMFVTLLEIMLSVFAVYGFHHLVFNIIYMLFCREKDKIHIAYISDGKKCNFSEIFFAKNAFLGRSRVIILVKCDAGELCPNTDKEKASGNEFYRAERVE